MADGTYKKIWTVKKNSANNKYFLRQANLDGSDDHTVELEINPYRNVNFVYYAFSTDSFVEREPDTASWDILFTKYIAIQPNGDPYPVVGVYNNFDVYSNEFYPVAPDFIDYASIPFDSTKSPTGWEWKTFDMAHLHGLLRIPRHFSLNPAPEMYTSWYSPNLLEAVPETLCLPRSL